MARRLRARAGGEAMRCTGEGAEGGGGDETRGVAAGVAGAAFREARNRSLIEDFFTALLQAEGSTNRKKPHIGDRPTARAPARAKKFFRVRPLKTRNHDSHSDLGSAAC